MIIQSDERVEKKKDREEEEKHDNSKDELEDYDEFISGKAMQQWLLHNCVILVTLIRWIRFIISLVAERYFQQCTSKGHISLSVCCFCCCCCF